MLSKLGSDSLKQHFTALVTAFYPQNEGIFNHFFHSPNFFTHLLCKKINKIKIKMKTTSVIMLVKYWARQRRIRERVKIHSGVTFFTQALKYNSAIVKSNSLQAASTQSSCMTVRRLKSISEAFTPITFSSERQMTTLSLSHAILSN